MKSVCWRVSLALLLVVGLACSSNPDDTMPAPASQPFVRPANLTTTFGTTEQLVADPLTREKVEALHKLTLQNGVIRDPTDEHGYHMGLVPTVAGKETGIDGRSGPEWLAFHDVESTISRTDAIALLRHEDPAIRVYFISHATAATENDLASVLYPMLADTTSVDVRYGCTGSSETVADKAMEKIASGPFDRPTRTPRDILTIIIEDDRIPPHTRSIALEDLAYFDPTSALSLARTAAFSSNAEWKREGITVLSKIAKSTDIDLIAAEVTSTDLDDRENAARALGRIDSTQSRDLLEPLLKDPHAEVIEAAAESYAFQSSASDSMVTDLLFRKDGVRFAAAQGLARRATLHALEIFEPALMREDSPIDRFGLQAMILHIGLPAAPIVRNLLGSESYAVRSLAAEALGQLFNTPAK